MQRQFAHNACSCLNDRMMDQLSPQLSQALSPLFEVLPLDQAMPRLVEAGHQPSAHVGVVSELVQLPLLQNNPAWIAGLWLYVDELDTSHTVSQAIDNPTGSYWHGIMHRREGDFSNSHYWFRKVGNHPAMAQVGNGYDAHQFIDEVEAAVNHGKADDPELLTMQRREWITLMNASS